MFLKFVLYDLLFFWTYIVVSTGICLHQGYNIVSNRMMREIKEGCKSICISLPLSNVVSMIAMPYTNTMITPFSVVSCIEYLFLLDMFQFFFHYSMHQVPYLYKTIHKHHHSTTYVTPFSALILDFKEHIITGIVPTTLPLFMMDISILGWVISNMFIFLHGLFIHSTKRLPYEGRFLLGSHNHAHHHIHVKSHFGLLNPMWDMLFDTLPYHLTGEQVNNKIMRFYNKPHTSQR